MTIYYTCVVLKQHILITTIAGILCSRASLTNLSTNITCFGHCITKKSIWTGTYTLRVVEEFIVAANTIIRYTF